MSYLFFVSVTVMSILFISYVMLGFNLTRMMRTNIEFQSYKNKPLKPFSFHTGNHTRKIRVADGCKHVYIDTGCNRGVQIRKFFEPELYPGAPIIELYDKYFGSVQSRREQSCVFGFEVNTNLDSRLKTLEECHQKQGWKTSILVGRAVSSHSDEIVSFYRPKNDRGDIGVTFADSNFLTERFDVETFDLGKFIEEEVIDRYIPPDMLSDGVDPFVFLKLDIEASEYQVLTSLLFRGLWCKINATTAEYHHENPWILLTDQQREEGKKAFDAFQFFLSGGIKWTGCKSMTNIHWEDESFADDNNDVVNGKCYLPPFK